MGSAKFFLSERNPGLDGPQLDSIIRSALIEDIGRGDITTQLTVPENKFIKAVFLAKEDCVACGLAVAKRVLRTVDARIKFTPLVKEGQMARKGKIIARIQGRAGSILSAERVALNFLTLLSGIATKTREYVNKVRPHKVKITDTRKTIPCLRELQKYAVRIGGGYNHRERLDEMVMVKDNHLQVSGDRFWAIGLDKIRNKIPAKIKVEIEVKNLNEFRKAFEMKPDIILLDNMSTKEMKKAVAIRNSLTPNTYHISPKLEVSGGITLKNIKKAAGTGVEFISVGALTHSVKSADISLEVL
jgi:nicotinate-nucleotide pyrophosphorylase (carboxylating)